MSQYRSSTKLDVLDGSSNLSCRAVQSIGSDLWIGTNQGIFLHSPNGDIHFNTTSGLPSRIIKQRGFWFEDGVMTVATAKGIAKVAMSEVQFSKTPTPVIESFLVGDKPVFSVEERQEISHHSNVELSYKSFAYPGYDIVYQSRILGLSEEWNSPSVNQIISLFGISRGDYTLEVRAKSVGHLWSDVARVSFHVKDPWYLTWWAYMIFLITAVIVVVLTNKIYHNNLINQKKLLQRLVAESTKEIEKHQEEIIEQKNRIIAQKEELLEKKEAVFKAQQAMTDTDLKYLKLKENQLQDQIEYRNKQITTHTLNIIQKNETLLGLKSKLEGVLKHADPKATVEIKRTIKFIDESFKLDKDWEDFKLYFEQIYTGFYAKLKINYPDLTNHELKHCALIRLNLSIQECASILGISPESIKVSRTRIRKKVDAESGVGLTEFILSL